MCCKRSTKKDRSAELPTDPVFMPNEGEGEYYDIHKPTYETPLISTYTGATYTGAAAGPTTTKTMSLEEYEEYQKNSGATYTGTTAGPTTMGATYTSPRLVRETSPMLATTTYAGATYTGTTT